MTTKREDVLGACARLASGQYGLITTEQGHACGLSGPAIRRLVRAGRWKKTLPRMFEVSPTANRWARDVTAVGLWLGDKGAISHRAAGAWWDLDACTKQRPEASSMVRTALPGVLIHHVADLPRVDRGPSHGIYVTSPTRTVIDLAAVATFEVFEAATHSAL